MFIISLIKNEIISKFLKNLDSKQRKPTTIGLFIYSKSIEQTIQINKKYSFIIIHIIDRKLNLFLMTSFNTINPLLIQQIIDDYSEFNSTIF